MEFEYEFFIHFNSNILGFPSGSVGKEFACNAGDRVRSLGQEDAMVKDVATYSSILSWRIPWTEEPGRLPVHGIAELDTTVQLTFTFTLIEV